VLGETPPASITRDAAQALLVKDAARFEPAVNALIPPDCTQNQFNALLDFCYNEGPAALATMMHHGWDQIPVQILAWCYEHVNGVALKVPGLLSRRKKELALFEQGEQPAAGAQ
jgi:lysozyme